MPLSGRMPQPLIVNTAGLHDQLPANVMPAWRDPSAVGVKRTSIVQLSPTGRAPTGQVSAVVSNSAALSPKVDLAPSSAGASPTEVIVSSMFGLTPTADALPPVAGTPESATARTVAMSGTMRREGGNGERDMSSPRRTGG